jgi:crotonobetainyl-CoA:carnitine CoA-transferase CaiB-like acyl-CoA transferase
MRPLEGIRVVALLLGVQNERQWSDLCTTVLGRPELARDPDFATNEARVRNRGRLEAIIEERIAGDARADLEARLLAADVPVGVYNTIADLVGHPQLTARARWVDVDTPNGPVRALRSPLSIGGADIRPGAVPAIDEHGEELRREVRRTGWSDRG